MFYNYKKIILSILAVILVIIAFVFGITFGSPTTVVQKSEAQIQTDDKTKKINEDIDVSSSEGKMSFSISNATFSKSSTDSKKKITFDVSIKTKETFSYLLVLKDEQNQEIYVKYNSSLKEQKIDIFSFDLKNEQEESKLFLFVYPVSEEKSKSKKLEGLAYSKVLFDVKEIKQKTIDSLK